jgi:hypothetical protein
LENNDKMILKGLCLLQVYTSYLVGFYYSLYEVSAEFKAKLPFFEDEQRGKRIIRFSFANVYLFCILLLFL